MEIQFGFLKRIWVLAPLMFILDGCGGGGGGEESSTPPPVAKVPTVNISAEPANPISYGTAVTITWSSTDATSCIEMAGAGFATGGATSGSDDSSELTEDTTFTASCTGAGGTISKSVTVMVDEEPPDTFRIDKHRIWPAAVYKDELPTALITYQIEMTLPPGWTAFVRFDRNRFVFELPDFVLVPIEDDDGDGLWEVTFATGIPEPILEDRDGKTSYVVLSLGFYDENGVNVFPLSPNRAGHGTTLGVVDRSINSTLSATSSPSIMRTRSAVFLRADDFQGTWQDVARVTRTVYDLYDDRFDYLIVSNIGWSYGDSPAGGGVDDFFGGAANFGSAGRLKGMAWMNDSHSHLGAIHEILHHRLFFFNDPALNMTVGDSWGAHIGACSISGPMSIGRFLTDNGDGTSTSGSLRADDGSPIPRHSLPMAEPSAWWYGFLPSFTPFKCVTDASVDVWSPDPISNSLISTIDENAVISVYGNPPLSYADGQKDYNGLFLVISQGRFPDAATADYFTALADHLAGTGTGYITSKGFANPGSFNWTAHGAATLSFPTVP